MNNKEKNTLKDTALSIQKISGSEIGFAIALLCMGFSGWLLLGEDAASSRKGFELWGQLYGVNVAIFPQSPWVISYFMQIGQVFSSMLYAATGRRNWLYACATFVCLDVFLDTVERSQSALITVFEPVYIVPLIVSLLWLGMTLDLMTRESIRKKISKDMKEFTRTDGLFNMFLILAPIIVIGTAIMMGDIASVMFIYDMITAIWSSENANTIILGGFVTLVFYTGLSEMLFSVSFGLTYYLTPDALKGLFNLFKGDNNSVRNNRNTSHGRGSKGSNYRNNQSPSRPNAHIEGTGRVAEQTKRKEVQPTSFDTSNKRKHKPTSYPRVKRE